MNARPNTERAHLFLLYGGLFLIAILLLKFAADFTFQFSFLAAPLWLLTVVTLATLAVALRRSGRAVPVTPRQTVVLLAAIPLALLASSLDCMGLALRGCTPYCTFVKLALIPALALLALSYYMTRRKAILCLVTALSFAALVPHCLCDNPANHWWIVRIGASPQCYAWGFATGLLAVAALLGGWRPKAIALLCYLIIGGAFSFFIGHHYLRFPW